MDRTSENIINSSIYAKTGVTFIGLLLAFLAFYLLLTRVDAYLKFKAADQCARVSRVEKSDGAGGKLTYPVQEIYSDCIKRAGIK